MNIDVEFHIRHNYPWNKLPANVRQSLSGDGSSWRSSEEELCCLYSICNQLRYRNNLNMSRKMNPRSSHAVPLPSIGYYGEGLEDKSPFSYYPGITEDIMNSEKSYDSLPNFTAADCLRLLGIGRNQYIDLMIQCRSSKKFFRRKTAGDLLPIKPVEIATEAWWVVQAGCITEDDIKICTLPEKCAIDKIIDSGPQFSGSLDYNVVHSLCNKGFVYLDVPMSDDSCIAVAPLGGFILVSIDEHTNVAELANVLEIDLSLVKNAVSISPVNRLKNTLVPQKMLLSWDGGECRSPIQEASSATDTDTNSQEDPADTGSVSSLSLSTGHTKCIAFLFDSTLTAFLMMGYLSPVQSAGEGEAQRYFDHALTLRNNTVSPSWSGPCNLQQSSKSQLCWFKLYIYHITGQGPPSLLLSKGTRPQKLPDIFQSYDRLLITSWGHDPGVVPTSNVLTMLNDALTHSAVLIQGHGLHGIGETVHVPFPSDETELQGEFTRVNMGVHKALQILRKRVDLQHLCGYVTRLNASSQLANRKLSDASDEREEPDLASGSDVNGSTELFEMVIEEATIDSATKQTSGATTEADWVPLELCFGIPLFSSKLNRKVYRKIATHGLCRKERLQNLLHSSRKLSLQVLNFVHSFQEGASTLDIHTEPSFSSLLSQSSYADMGVPLPAKKNLIFKDGVLSEGGRRSPSSLLIANLHLQ
uniref:FAM91 C-terminal domain-containing protein n=1 Tax=Pan paniscus TaxID=9597 RepID=A0A2R9B059_PANPA